MQNGALTKTMKKMAKKLNVSVKEIKKYQQMNYEPVTETLVYEGEEAHIISRLF